MLQSSPTTSRTCFSRCRTGSWSTCFLVLLLLLRFQTMSDQIISRIDDMGSRIDDLEHNINDLMAQVLHFPDFELENYVVQSQAGQSGGPPALENKDQGDPK